MARLPTAPTMPEVKTPSVAPQSEHFAHKMEWDSVWGHPRATLRHEKTSVMLLTWDPHHDDLNVQEEVGQLRDVFRDEYGFEVRQAQLTAKKPQQQALRELADFVWREDSSTTLLIIYYAGHGHGINVGPGDMRLEGNRRPDAVQDYKKTVVWSTVETAIRETKADVLLIFDCCHAGLLCRPYRNAGLQSSFQFLGACTEDQTTQGPGDGSFTKALIWALRKLAGEDRAFSSGELQKTITKYEHFPPGQQPVLSDRRDPWSNIVIARQGLDPVSVESATISCQQRQHIERKEHVDVRLHFEHKVDSNHVRDTAEALKRLTQETKIWSRVTFRKKASVVEEIAVAWKQRARDSTSRKSFSNTTPIGQSIDPYEQHFASPMSKPTLNLSIPVAPLTPAESIEPPVGIAEVGNNEQSLHEHTVQSRMWQLEDESITFHLRSIATKLRLKLSRLFSWLAHKIIPRSDYERLPDTEP